MNALLSGASRDVDGYSNPFSTRYVMPGAIPYRFPEGDDLDRCVRRLGDAGRWGQIVGPHGTGKSTLLAALRQRLVASGEYVVMVTLHDGQRRLPSEWMPTFSSRTSDATLVIVDGYEQLCRTSRWMLQRTCRRRRWGLVVTAHRSVGLPTLVQTTTNVQRLAGLVRELSAQTPFTIPDERLAELLVTHHGNVRSVLFDLYDRYEAARRHC